MKILFYKLRKSSREISFQYWKWGKMIEISFYFYNLIIIWGRMAKYYRSVYE